MTNDNFAFSSFLDNLQSFNQKRSKYFALFFNLIRFERDLPVNFSILRVSLMQDEKKINSNESVIDNLHAIHCSLVRVICK